MGKPAGPGAFKSCMWNKVDLISSGDGVVRRLAFSSSVTQGRVKCSRWVGKWTSSSLNRCLKFSRKNCLMSLDSELHEPSSVLITLILFLLLQMMVERWKDFEFLSPSFSQISLDFCRHKVSLRNSHSASSDWREVSRASFS